MNSTLGVVRTDKYFFVPFVFKDVENSVAKYVKTIENPTVVTKTELGYYMTSKQFDFYKGIVEDLFGQSPEPVYSKLSNLTNMEIDYLIQHYKEKIDLLTLLKHL